MCLAKGHIAVKPVMLEPAAPRSRVKHSTTEPLSHCASIGVVNDRTILPVCFMVILGKMSHMSFCGLV